MHLKGSGCPKCIGRYKTTEEFIENSLKKHGDLYDYSASIYTNYKTKVDIICKKHGIFKQIPNEHIRGSGCPNCRKSRGELEIRKLLKFNNIDFKSQYYFSNLQYINLLYFDFAILNNNKLVCLIEYNGQQHYKFVKVMYKSEEEFLIAQFRDKLKKEYCEDNNIDLFIINYNDKIADKLNKILSVINSNDFNLKE